MIAKLRLIPILIGLAINIAGHFLFFIGIAVVALQAGHPEPLAMNAYYFLGLLAALLAAWMTARMSRPHGVLNCSILAALLAVWGVVTLFHHPLAIYALIAAIAITVLMGWMRGR